MFKLNNKGFAISTMLYGLLVLVVMIVALLMNTLAFTRKNSSSFALEIRDELQKKKLEAKKTYLPMAFSINMPLDQVDVANVQKIFANYVLIRSNNIQYGPYDKTLKKGVYRVTYYVDSLTKFINDAKYIYCQEYEIGPFNVENVTFCNYKKDDDNCYVQDLPASSVEKATVSYIVTLFNDVDYNGIELGFNFLGENHDGINNLLQLQKIEIEKIDDVEDEETSDDTTDVE